MTTEELVRKKGLLERFPISKRTLQNLMNRRVIPFYKINRTVFFSLPEVDKALKRYRVKEVG